MSMNRYEIRNEYSLADPELYLGAHKDDPEALLEGVAMAGLVGILRQLGDLAEFAADIFHNLHEEVMTTATRGHNVTVRVQQLERELPSIERAFLSQTDHSSVFYNTGVDWHRNSRMEQNLITREDLPRFIMDSYEECRGPPRLFLLDKFDVAGAGSCLKRYSDPSFFKVEMSGMTNSDAQREMNILRPKKKVPRLKNGESRELVPELHANLHQLFLEESGDGNSIHRARLKRRLNGFPFDSKSEKSYMEKILKSPSPDRMLLREVDLNSLSSHIFYQRDDNDSGLEVLETRSVSSNSSGKRNPPLTSGGEEIVRNSSIYDLSEVPMDDRVSALFNPYHNFAANGISTTNGKENGEKVISVDVVSNKEGISTDYESDGISSDVENYVDAPLTVDSEMDSEPEMRMENGLGLPPLRSRELVSNVYEEINSARSSESHFTGCSTTTDEENNLSRKEISIFSSSDSPSTRAEIPQPEQYSKGLPSVDIPEIEVDEASSYLTNAEKGYSVDQHQQLLAGDNMHTAIDASNNLSSDIELPTGNESGPTFMNSDTEVVTKDILILPGNNEASANRNPVYPQEEGGSVRPSVREHLVDEQNDQSVPCLSTVSDSNCPTADSLVTLSMDFPSEGESDKEDSNLVANINISSNLMPSENPKFDNEFSEILENLSPSSPDKPASVGGNVETENAVVANIPSHIEQHMGSFEVSSLNELDGDNAYHLTGSQEEPSLVNEEAADGLHFVNGSLLHERGLDTKQQSALFNHDSADEIFHVDYDTEESKIQEEVGLAPSRLDLKLLHPSLVDNRGKDNAEFEVLHPSDLQNRATLPVDSNGEGSKETEIIGFLLNQLDQEIEQSLQNHSTDTVALLIDCDAEESNVQEKIELPPNELDQESPLLPSNQQNMLHHDYHVGESYSSLDITEATQISLSESPPLPPLPPFQWRMGKIQRSSLTTEGETKKHMELRPQLISPLISSNDGVSSSSLTASADNTSSSSLRAPANDIIVPTDSVSFSSLTSQLDEINPSTTLANGGVSSSSPTASADNTSSSSLRAPADDIIVPTEGVNFSSLTAQSDEINPSTVLTGGGGVSSSWLTASADNTNSSSLRAPGDDIIVPTEGANFSSLTAQSDEINPSTALTDGGVSSSLTAFTKDVNSSPPVTPLGNANLLAGVMNHPLVQTASKTTSKEEKVEHSSTISANLEAKDTDETVDLLQKIESKQQLVAPAPESKSTVTAEEDGDENVHRPVKLPHPPNPLAGNAAFFDKNKLRKVSEQIRPQVQKVNEGNSLLEQIRTRSFNLRPTMASRPSFQGPRTNLKVAALLEKANSIRQACAGSDDDDEDSWSDS